MTQDFRSFVIFAEMRTGSNLLEASLNAVRHVTCFGEAFNPSMIGWPGRTELCGVTREQREKDPMVLLRAMTEGEGRLSGFRYFHDHDPRVFDAIIEDRRCAKILLGRNPLDSYVSMRLARKTNQWKLNETQRPDEIAITYDGAEFRRRLAVTGAFRDRVTRRLQTSGQSAFRLDYKDLRDPHILGGLLQWLGRSEMTEVSPANHLVPQNPREMWQKVSNFAEMQADLRDMDPFDLMALPVFEPARGPAVPGFMTAGAGQGLLFMPVPGGLGQAVANWMRALGPVQDSFTQSTLRQWKRDYPGHRSMTLLRHPLWRAWDAFLDLIWVSKPELRQMMRDIYDVPLPPDSVLSSTPQTDLAGLFAHFLGFLRRNLNGQTSLSVHPHWASQTGILAGFSRFSQPDMVIREENLYRDLPHLCRAAGIADPRIEALTADRFPQFLMQPGLAAAAKAAYRRDYMNFGFAEYPQDPCPS